MSGISIWVRGITRSGKTSRLIEHFTTWVKRQSIVTEHEGMVGRTTALILAANENTRRSLTDRLVLATGSDYPIICKTPLGFMSEEVMLFWPLVFESLQLKAQFPLRLRPETEQDLATRLWRQFFAQEDLSFVPSQEYRLIRDTLDLMQLAGAAGIAVEEIATRLVTGWPSVNDQAVSPQQRQDFLITWRNWCLARGLLTYGLISDLYWRYLLLHPHYQQQLLRRYHAIFADDVDDYPAIARDLSEFLLQNGVLGVFTYNPHAQIRLGLNADPEYWEGLAKSCQLEELPDPQGLATEWATPLLTLITDPFFNTPISDSFQSIQTTSRAKLLRQTANFIIDAVHSEQVKPEEIAIIAPGLDEIARYTLMEILTAAKVTVTPLNEQRSLISSPLIRALLTLLALIYPGLDKLAMRDDVAEMLVVLSQKPEVIENSRQRLISDIDPVRAGLIADHCYQIDLEQPQLLPIETFARWDRLGYRATVAYQQLMTWIDTARNAIQTQPQVNSPIFFLDRAIRELLPPSAHLTYDQMSALRELMETAQHFWEVERRLQQSDAIANSLTQQLKQFIQLLRRGTITANPRPLYSLGKEVESITLATIFQYRSLRQSHRWQFWLDAGSSLWIQGGAAQLFAAPLFLQDWSEQEWNSEMAQQMDQARLERIVWDLLGRVEERIFLCHSDLSVQGTEQTGPFLTLIQRAEPAIAQDFQQSLNP